EFHQTQTSLAVEVYRRVVPPRKIRGFTKVQHTSLMLIVRVNNPQACRAKLTSQLKVEIAIKATRQIELGLNVLLEDEAGLRQGRCDYSFSPILVVFQNPLVTP